MSASAVSKQSLRVSKSLLFFFFFFSSSSLDTTATSMHVLLSCYIYIYFSFSNNPNWPRCCELFKFNQLFLFHQCEWCRTQCSDSRVAVCPSYRTKINLIPQFRLLVHARCVNAAMLVEMYILFETRDPVVSLLFKYVNHGSATRVPHPETAILDPLFFPLHFHTRLPF